MQGRRRGRVDLRLGRTGWRWAGLVRTEGRGGHGGARGGVGALEREVGHDFRTSWERRRREGCKGEGVVGWTRGCVGRGGGGQDW